MIYPFISYDTGVWASTCKNSLYSTFLLQKKLKLPHLFSTLELLTYWTLTIIINRSASLEGVQHYVNEVWYGVWKRCKSLVSFLLFPRAFLFISNLETVLSSLLQMFCLSVQLSLISKLGGFLSWANRFFCLPPRAIFIMLLYISTFYLITCTNTELFNYKETVNRCFSCLNCDGPLLFTPLFSCFADQTIKSATAHWLHVPNLVWCAALV